MGLSTAVILIGSQSRSDPREGIPHCVVCVCVGVSVQAHCEICRFHWVVSLFFYYYFLNYYSSHHWYTLMIGGFIHSITLFGMVFFFSCLSCN